MTETTTRPAPPALWAGNPLAERAAALEAEVAAASRAGHAAICADAALELARTYWSLGQLDAASASVEHALDVLERAGLRRRLGAAYTLHARILVPRDKASLALAACNKALGYPDLGPTERMHLFEVAAIALFQLVDLETGAKVLLEHAWPAAQSTGDAATIVKCATRCVGMFHEKACWDAGIPMVDSFDLRAPAPRTAREYLDEAWQLIARFEPRVAEVGADDHARWLVQKATVVALDHGFDAALPIQAVIRQLPIAPRIAFIAEESLAKCARIAGRWELARELFLNARKLAGGDTGMLRREIAWELSYIEQKLDNTVAALAELREFELLQRQRMKLASEWFADAANRSRYGASFDIRAIRESLCGKPVPQALVRAMQYIESHLGFALSADVVARSAGVGKRTLQNLFREHSEVGFSEFVRERRLQRADQALRCDGDPIAIVAERLGYSSAANFSRDYRKRFGRSPTATRRDAQSVARQVTPQPSADVQRATGVERRRGERRQHDRARAVDLDGG